MIKFFRQIRKRLFQENRFSKYLFYAIGEILLVVIGILIALQVNNWNEERKTKEFEKKLLIDLRRFIVQDYESVIPPIKANYGFKRSAEIILDHFDRDLPYNDSLAPHFYNTFRAWKLILQRGSYEKAKLYGLEFIINDTTRERLTELYETNASYIETLDDRRSLYYYNTATPILTHLFEPTHKSHKSSLQMYTRLDTTIYPMSDIPKIIKENMYYGTTLSVPYNYEALKQNKAYRNILKTTIVIRQEYIGYALWTLSIMVDLEKRLQIELDNR